MSNNSIIGQILHIFNMTMYLDSLFVQKWVIYLTLQLLIKHIGAENIIFYQINIIGSFFLLLLLNMTTFIMLNF